MPDKTKPKEALFLARLAWYGFLGVTNLSSKSEVWHRIGNDVRPIIIGSKHERGLVRVLKFVTGVITLFDLEKQEADKELLLLRGEAKGRRERGL